LTTSGRATDILEFVITLKLDSRRVGRRRAAAPTGMRANPWWTLAGVCIGVIMAGVAPTVPGSPSQPTHAIVEGSHAAFMAGLHTAMIVAAAAAGVGALLALLATTGRDAGPA
jgi:Na+/proline symporter